MILSVASSTDYFRNIETPSVDELIPEHIREGSQNLLSFIKRYYDFLNQEGLPSHAISRITNEHDIDQTSGIYLDAIQNEIAKTVPNSKVLDRVSLYKKIVKYYGTRGSEESALTFFRIFFDEIVSIIYPKDFLFKLSDGAWNGSSYDDRRSFISDINKLRDGFFYQEFSYQLKTSLSSDNWENEYLGLVHPAGLRLFAELLLSLVVSNDWNSPIDYSTDNPLIDFGWLDGLIPPYLKDGSSGFHSPLFQPGWLSGNGQKLFILAQALEFPNAETSYTRLMLLTLKYLIGSINSRMSAVREEYQTSIKFFDPSPISSWSGCTIDQAEEAFSELNGCRFTNIGCFVSTSINTYYPWNVSSVDDTTGSPITGWIMSGVTPGDTSSQSGWTNGSVEPIV